MATSGYKKKARVFKKTGYKKKAATRGKLKKLERQVALVMTLAKGLKPALQHVILWGLLAGTMLFFNKDLASQCYFRVSVTAAVDLGSNSNNSSVPDDLSASFANLSLGKEGTNQISIPCPGQTLNDSRCGR
jgi:hypothetical protein